MPCGCNNPIIVQSWNDFNNVEPQDPLQLITYATLFGIPGTWALSDDYNKPLGGSSWIATPFTISSEIVVSANGSDQLQNVSDADQWNFTHATVNTASTLAIPMRKLVFLRSGVAWTNTIPLNLGAATYSNIQLSFLDNAAIRGDSQGTIPVINWNGAMTGSGNLTIVITRPGRYSLGMRAKDTAGPPNYSMFEMDVVAV